MKKILIFYDFDGTLIPDSMQRQTIFKYLNIDHDSFWKEVIDNFNKINKNSIYFYMELLLKKSKENGFKVDKKFFKTSGQNLKFYNGVETFFDDINNYASKFKIKVENYIVSSGIKDVIDSTKIRNKFKGVYASEYNFEDGIAIEPGFIIDDEAKVEIIEMVYNKNKNEDVVLIYIGDGETDIPAMDVVKGFGGFTILVYNKSFSKDYINKKDIIDFIFKADYTKNGEIYKKIVDIINNFIF